MVILGPKENSEFVSSVSQTDSYVALPKSALNHNVTLSQKLTNLMHKIFVLQ